MAGPEDADRPQAAAQGAIPLDGEEAAREARLRTLLPIFRNIAFVVLAVVAVMMALSAVGVEIAPLIAGAGVGGVRSASARKLSCAT